MFIVYSMLNQHNGKRYIGYTSKGLKHRRDKHFSKLRNNNHVNRHLQSMWNRGDRYLLWVVLEVCDSLRMVKSAEIKWIAHYNTTDNRYGYNLTHGGEGVVATEEVRHKMSVARRGKPLSQEHRAKMSIANTGRKMSETHKAKLIDINTGRIHSEETRLKMSAARKGQKLGPQTAEHRYNISVANTGKTLTAEHRANISAARKGKKLGPQTAEHRAKISATLKAKKRKK